MKPLALLLLLAASPYRAELEAWRVRRAQSLAAEDGWLSLVARVWLKEGSNTFGSDPSNDIVLPARAPARAGTVEFRGGKVTIGGRQLKVNSPDAYLLGRMRILAIQRGDRVAIRVKDPDAPTRRDFKGLDWFPPDEKWRIRARWVAEPGKLPITNVLGQTEPMESPGYAVFTVGGQERRLRPVLEAPDAKELFWIFRDATAGKETYGAGRFLDGPMPKGGTVELDFNRAYNPPCAFTPYATCPLPPKENRLSVRIPAGEKTYAGGH